MFTETKIAYQHKDDLKLLVENGFQIAIEEVFQGEDCESGYIYYCVAPDGVWVSSCFDEEVDAINAGIVKLISKK